MPPIDFVLQEKADNGGGDAGKFGTGIGNTVNNNAQKKKGVESLR